MSTKHVSAKFGNNANNGNDKNNSYLTLQQGITQAGSDGIINVYDGKYLEQQLINTVPFTINGIGKVIMDGSLFNSFSSNNQNKTFNNLSIINYTDLGTGVGYITLYQDCYLKDVGLSYKGNSTTNFIRTTIDSSKDIYPIHYTGGSQNLIIKNCSITGAGKFTIALLNELSLNEVVFNIFKNKPIDIINVTSCKIKWNDFYNCSIDITADALGAITYDGTSGKTIDDLRQRAADYYSGGSNPEIYFPDCQIKSSTNYCFTDDTIGEKNGFYLNPLSSSATRNYITGKHIGALPVARGLIFPTGYTLGSNIQADGTLLDKDNNVPADNTISYTNPFDHTKVILVEKWGEGVLQAERNGDINSIDKDTADVARLHGDPLHSGNVYVCEGETASITDGVTSKEYAVGENCTVPAGSWTVVSTTGLGYFRELYTNLSPTINVMLSRTDATLTVSGEVSYLYGDATKTPSYLKFYINAYDGLVAKAPMVIIDADGIPVLGDADAGFQYTGHALGSAVRIQMRYEKRKAIIQTANAKS